MTRCRVSELRHKEVINIRDGARLGFVCDVELDELEGYVDSIVVPGPAHFFGIFGRDEDYIINWDEIEKIGEGIILVSVVFPSGRHKTRTKKYSKRYSVYAAYMI